MHATYTPLSFPYQFVSKEFCSRADMNKFKTDLQLQKMTKYLDVQGLVLWVKLLVLA